MSEEETAARAVLDLYERRSEAWIRARSHFPERGWIDRLSGLALRGGAVLDLGCGAGAPIAARLAEAGFQVTGVDGAPSLVDAARRLLPGETWIVADMRRLALGRRFDAVVAWCSLFHLTPDDQRAMFPVFADHAAPGAPLLFTSGDRAGVSIGAFEGEPLYHASFDASEYRALLERNGFSVEDHVVRDRDCGEATVWLATRNA